MVRFEEFFGCDDKPQVIEEYDFLDNLQRRYLHGNYIDEVLYMYDDSGESAFGVYYTHDHLFSPTALTDTDGTVIERYEYDAYGKANIMDAK